MSINKGRHFNLGEFIRYGAVGLINTAVTLGTIVICKSVIGINPYVSNAIGYVLGLINSFLWNRSWVFRGHNGKISSQAIRFIVGFGLCYALQLLVVWILSETVFSHVEIHLLSFLVSGYGISTVIGNIFYTITNYLYNRHITFK